MELLLDIPFKKKLDMLKTHVTEYEDLTNKKVSSLRNSKKESTGIVTTLHSKGLEIKSLIKDIDTEVINSFLTQTELTMVQNQLRYYNKKFTDSLQRINISDIHYDSSKDSEYINSEIKLQHHDIMILNKKIQELYQLFIEMNILLDLQSENIEKSQQVIQNSAHDMNEAVTILAQAESHVMAVRKKKLAIVVMVVAMIGAVLLVVTIIAALVAASMGLFA